MKKITYTLLMILSINASMFAQAVLPVSWDFTGATIPATGWTAVSGGNNTYGYYSGSGNPQPAAKFSGTGDKLTINFNSAPGAIGYDLSGNNANVPWSGTFTVEESANGTTWTTVGSAYTSLTPANTYNHFSNTLLSTSRYVRFNYTNKVSGNVGLDNVTIAAGVTTTQTINVKQGSTTIVNGGTYTTSSQVSTPSTITLTVQNTGTVNTLHISGIALSGPAASDYAITSQTSFNVAPSSDSTLTISFTPSAAGTRNAVVTITSDDSNNNTSYVVNLNGIGGNLATEPTAQPTALTFPINKSYRISGSFTAASPAPDGYIVLRSNGSPVSGVPVDGTSYQRGDMIGNSKVVYSSNATGFMPNEIRANMHCYFVIYAYNGTGSYRNYLTTSPLMGDVTVSGSMLTNGFYSAINPTSSTFVTDLHNLVYPHTLQMYGNYGPLMVAGLYSRDTANNQRVVTCVYSGENKVYSEPFDWTTDNFSREHTYCESWMPTVNDPNYQNRKEYNDYHLLTPTNQTSVNAIRSNYPLGVVVGTPTYTYLGAKLGNDANGHKVWEPRDSDKGDAARCMLYECIAYTGDAYSGAANTTTTWGGTPATGTNIWSLPSSCYDAGSIHINYPQDQEVLKQWNQQDPPDNFEISRNDYVDSLQGNRNPFIDHPEYICYIDFSTMTYMSSGNCADTTHPAGITEYNQNNGITVSPNPNNGTFKINYSCEKNETINVLLTDMLGKVVYSNVLKGNIGNNNTEINVANINKGIYMLQWISDSNRKTQKLIIE